VVQLFILDIGSKVVSSKGNSLDMDYQQDTGLLALIKNLSPELNQGEYVFCTIPDNKAVIHLDAVAIFQEKEGRTLILKRQTADREKLVYQTVMSWISFNVYSSLDAVGLTAAISHVLAKNNISCNMIAAYHHDHVFVSYQDAEKAMAVLTQLSLE